VDLLFRSIVAHGGQKIVGAVLSGALDDGARGLAAIHRAGGLTMVITPHTDRFPGMPENAIAFEGRINVIGEPGVIAHAIVGIVNGGN
jgi:two-component system chemotaxis response regulator CheB